jgi:deoxyribose-phosphate aldolase
MDSDDLVRKISAEVLKRLGQDPRHQEPRRQNAAPPPAAARNKHVLVILTGGNRCLDEVFVQLGRIAESSQSITVVLSPSADRIIGTPAVRRAAPEARVVQQGDVWELLEGVGVIYLPCMSLNAASKIANLMPDSLACILAISGILRGIPVVAARDSLYPEEVDTTSMPPGVRSRVDALMRELEALGVRLCDVDKMTGSASEEGRQTADPSPHPGCAQAAVGECEACGHCVENRPAEVQHLVSSGAVRVGSAPGARPASADIGRFIDHTLLKPDATEDQIRKLCEEARQFGFASVCVNPSWVPLCAELLAASDIKVCTVVGFPLGATTPTAKAIETRDAIANGATEIDMVINVGALKSGDDELVRRDIESVVAAAAHRAIVKVILETALLSKEEIVKACLLAKMAKADFVKTSTGFSGGGATVEDIALMRETVGPKMGVKASGGIRDRETAERMVAAGATRIGASASVAIATGEKTAQKGY